MPPLLSGSIWSSCNAAAAVLLPFGIFVAFARLLPVADIGLVALAVACAELLKTCGLPGLYEAMLCQPHDTARMQQTALAVLLTAGAVLTVGFVALILALSDAVPGIAGHRLPLSLVGLRILLDLAGLQPQANLAQRLQYRRMAVRSVVANLAAGAAGLGLASWGDALWGLVAYQVLQPAITLAVTVAGTRALARPVFHRDCWRLMRREASWASAVRLVASANNSLDQILIADLIGPVRLGYFNLAKRVEVTFVTVSQSFVGILFQPLFAAATPGQRGPALQRALALTLLVCGLPAAVFVVNSRAVIGLAFGPRWQPAAAVAAVLAISGCVRALGSVHGALLSISGRNRAVLVVASVAALAGVAAVVVGARFGLLACSLGLLAKNAGSSFWQARLTRQDAPGIARFYLVQIVAPFALMLLAASLGTAAGDPLLRLLLSGAGASAVAGLYFGWRFFPELAARRAPRPGVA